MNDDLEPRVRIIPGGQLVIQGEIEGMRDDCAYINLEDWAEIRGQADAAIRRYAEALLQGVPA